MGKSVSEKGMSDELVKVLQDFQSRNIVCPLPIPWNKMYKMIPSVAGKRLEYPLILGGWGSSDIEKFQRFKYHLEVAEKRGVLKDVTTFLKTLSIEDWLIRSRPLSNVGYWDMYEKDSKENDKHIKNAAFLVTKINKSDISEPVQEDINRFLAKYNHQFPNEDSKLNEIYCLLYVTLCFLNDKFIGHLCCYWVSYEDQNLEDKSYLKNTNLSLEHFVSDHTETYFALGKINELFQQNMELEDCGSDDPDTFIDKIIEEIQKPQ